MPQIARTKKAATIATYLILTGLLVSAAAFAWYYFVIRDPFSLTFVDFRTDASGKIAVFNLRNRSSTREISFRLDARVFFRTQNAEWVVQRKSEPAIKYRGQVNPGQTVEYPIRVHLANGDPIREPFQIGIPYSTPSAVPSIIRGFFGIRGRLHEVYWTEMIVP
jgi:hypothetical protein